MIERERCSFKNIIPHLTFTSRFENKENFVKNGYCLINRLRNICSSFVLHRRCCRRFLLHFFCFSSSPIQKKEINYVLHSLSTRSLQNMFVEFIMVLSVHSFIHRIETDFLWLCITQFYVSFFLHHA